MDIDEEESVDFRVLLGKGSKSGSSNIPKRGAKDFAPDGSLTQDSNLKEARKVLFEVISEERIPNTQLSEGIWLPQEQRVEITVKKGTHFNTMGYNEKSRLFLHPEEALFLLERGALVIQHHSVPMSLQQSYASLISQSCPFEKYQVYAYLKRLGYITLKHLENPAEQLPTEPEISNKAQTWLSTLMQYPTRMYEKILELLPGALASQKMTTLNQRYHTYDDIFKSLRTKSPEYLSRSSASDQWDRLDETESLSIDYDVYKPLPSFRKKAPGSPSFHIIVQKFEDTIPNPLAIERMKSLAEPKGEMLFAIASRGNISFVNMKTCETIVL